MKPKHVFRMKKWTILRPKPEGGFALATFVPKSEPQTGTMPIVFPDEAMAKLALDTLDYFRGGRVCEVEITITADKSPTPA